MRYKEIFRLKEMLEKASIPFEFFDDRCIIPDIEEADEGYQICYPCNDDKRVCSVIEHYGSYGHEDDLLEIMGLTRNDYLSVEGWLTAEVVFNRIENHYNSTGGKRNVKAW